MSLTLDIFIHMDAVGRNEFAGPGDERPLTELGQKQAQRIVEDLTADGPIAAIYSSPALRCRASLEPLSQKLGLPVQVAPGFKDTGGYKAPEGWERGDAKGPDPLGGAASAGSAYRALLDIRDALPDGSRAVLCSYGDIVPALLAFVSGANGIAMPPRAEGRGVRYVVTLDGDRASIAHHDASAGFPS
jgi:broad specificity phosphatase PhoE